MQVRPRRRILRVSHPPVGRSPRPVVRAERGNVTKLEDVQPGASTARARSIGCLGLFLLLAAAPLEAQTYISSAIGSDTTWTVAGSPYVVQATVPVTATLTVQPAVVVKFDMGARLDFSGSGRLLAQGTLAQPIYFTSSR